MARLKNRLLQKLERAFKAEFPPPATVRLDEHDGIIGVITSAKFAGMDTIDRQNWIGKIVKTSLNRDERHEVLVIVGVTPDEGTGYLASAD